jgi:hypothetical protein
MEETSKDKVTNMEDHAVLEYFEDVFKRYQDYLQREILISL